MAIKPSQLRFVPAGTNSDVFVSYEHGSSSIVDDLMSALSRDFHRIASKWNPNGFFGSQTYHNDILVFRDTESIRSGELWDHALIEAIFRTRTFMPILTEEYHRSPMCMFELMLFVGRGIITSVVYQLNDKGEAGPGVEISTLMPYRAEECTLPPQLQRYHAPLIPKKRPLTSEFIEQVGRQLMRAVDKAAQVITESATPIWVDFENYGRDIRGLKNLEWRAQELLDQCNRLLSQDSRPEEWQQAIEQIVMRTRAYLANPHWLIV
jgi:hypothetical protein